MRLFRWMFPKFNYYILGDIISGGLGFLGVKDTNKANEGIASARNVMEVEEAQKARDFSMSEAQKNRQFQSDQVAKQLGFQERMSSTAVRRRMADMKKAGINPLLAGKFDASSPAGAAASGGIGPTAKANAHGYTAQNKLQGMLNNVGTALSLKKLAAEIKNVEANTAYTGRKKDLTDPVNSMMEMLQSVIDANIANASQRNKVGSEIRDVLKSMSENFAKDQGYHVPEKTTPEKFKQVKKKNKLPGVKDSDRKPFNFERW